MYNSFNVQNPLCKVFVIGCRGNLYNLSNMEKAESFDWELAEWAFR